MFEKIQTFTEYTEYQNAISFHSATDTLHDYMELTNESDRTVLYIVVTK